MNELIKSRRPGKLRDYASIIAVLVIVAVAFIIFNAVFGGKFLTSSNISSVISHAVFPTFVAWGFCFIFGCGFIDMSVGAVVVLAATMAGTLGNAIGVGGVILGGVLTGALLLLLNFTVFVYTKIPAWIAGIGMAMIYEAVAVFYSRGRMAQGLTVVELEVQNRTLAQPPYIYIVLALGFVAAYVIYNYTTIGIRIRSLGGNREVSKALGINITKTLLIVGLISGIFIGCGAFVQESYIARMTAKTGLTSLQLTFQPMAALFLAQVLQKKINIIIAIPICSFIVYAIFNMLTIAGVASGTWQEAILGLIVILFGIIAQRNVQGVVK